MHRGQLRRCSRVPAPGRRVSANHQRWHHCRTTVPGQRGLCHKHLQANTIQHLRQRRLVLVDHYLARGHSAIFPFSSKCHMVVRCRDAISQLGATVHVNMIFYCAATPRLPTNRSRPTSTSQNHCLSRRPKSTPHRLGQSSASRSSVVRSAI